ncbi:hypothetical protein HYALB_00011362 [Hymenoscyphus albidus]|uniref:FAS1 domain-containing protein n=1 Tax=Hymenoscyphus albidus TaxID=595503 RepID=A0A9N9LN77_9HELO|nr:hypothetical protein HYALB_00011362 [Hymenoscyphus albidus]
MHLTYIFPLALTAVVSANIVKDPMPAAAVGQPAAEMPASMPMPAAAEAAPAMSENAPKTPGADSSPSGKDVTKTLTQILDENKAKLSTLNTLLGMEPGLLQMLNSMKDLTILAPSNAAFTKFEASAGNKAQVANKMMLAGILEYHVLKGMHMASSIPTKMVFLPSLLGAPMNMTGTGRTMGAAMKRRAMMEMEGMSGNMEGMEGMPGMAGMAPEAAAGPGSSAATNSTSSNSTSIMSNVSGGQVVGVVKNGNRVEVMSGFKEIATVETADLMYNGGVVHIIDNVMAVPRTVSSTALDSQLTALVGALKNTNLVTAVDTTRDVTVFAPNNDAFKAIGGTAATLDMQQLSTILQYHVVRGTVGYSTLLTMGLANRTLTTLAGNRLRVTATQNKVFVNSAQVVNADVLVNNGVMHVINEVMNPRNTTGVPNPAATVAPIAFEGAKPADQVPFTSGINPTTTAPSAATRTNAGSANDPIRGVVGAAALFGFVAAL